MSRKAVPFSSLFRLWQTVRRRGEKTPRQKFRPQIEPLEDRLAPAIFVVNSTGDLPDNNLNDGIAWTGGFNSQGAKEVTLRAAIQQSNHDGGNNTIQFNIPATEKGFNGKTWTINTVKLDTITTPTTVDGTTQKGYAGTPVVITNGSVVDVAAGNSVLQGLSILNSPGSGVGLHGKGNDKVLNDFIGIDPTGKAAGNNTGVEVSNVPNNLIANNVISGNKLNGINIFGNNATGNIIQTNLIGLDPTGKQAVGNQANGIQVRGAGKNLIGVNGKDGTAAAEGNVISGNTMNGVFIVDDGTGSTNDNIVAGNLIGTNKNGDAAVANQKNGVMVVLGPQRTIIGTNGDGFGDAAEGNVISGNKLNGVLILGDRVTNTVVAGNYIGTNKNGDGAVANGNHGVTVALGPTGTIIGTNGDGVSDSLEGNVISGNKFSGVNILSAQQTVVAGNYIGTNADGDAAIPNERDGVTVSGNNNRIGTNGDGVSDTEERNVISGNLRNGVRIEFGSKNVVAGNYIGINADGDGAIPNQMDGVLIETSATQNRIGVSSADKQPANDANVISGNLKNGVHISGTGTKSNVVAGNFIGTNPQGDAPIANEADGVLIDGGAQFNLIGSNGDGVADALESNIISGNAFNGVHISGNRTDNNFVAGNYVGTDGTGLSALPNGADGVLIDAKASQNLIGTGGTSKSPAGARNLISGNELNGVHVTGNGTFANLIAGNDIGTDLFGDTPLPNELDGVLIDGQASDTRIGTSGDSKGGAARANTISGNTLDGVRISGAGTIGTIVAGNFIGTDPTGKTAVPNQLDGVVIDSKATENVIGTTGLSKSPAVESNVISGNKLNGVRISDPGTAKNTVAGNIIGLRSDESAPLPNDKAGVLIEAMATDNIIGTNGDGRGDAAEANTISGNKLEGVHINGMGTSKNIVAGNFIGTDSTGMNAQPNEKDGVLIDGKATMNIVGTGGTSMDLAAENNLISGNKLNGVHISGAGTTMNRVAGNDIGITVDGSAALANEKEGVLIDAGATQNVIGTNGDGKGDKAEGNTISGNKLNGVHITGAGTNMNVVAGNRIGTDPAGKVARPNENSGVLIDAGAQMNLIGTNADGVSDALERNIISGNKFNGVFITGAGTDKNTLAGNYIGTQVDGKTKLPNEKEGVRIDDNASNNIIGFKGGARPEVQGNVIAFNGTALTGANGTSRLGYGIEIASGTGDKISRNSIFSNQGRGINLNQSPNLTINQLDAAKHAGKANLLQNYPVEVGVNFSGPMRVETWQLNSTPSTNFVIEFFSNMTPDSSGFGQGMKFIQDKTVKTDAKGFVKFPVSFNPADKLIAATATDPMGNTSEFSMVNTAADALADAWKTTGIDWNQDGVVDLMLPGANVNHKDLYVEVDAMKGRAPTAATMQAVVDAFATAPNALVQNPDGMPGISLHVALDETTLPVAAFPDIRKDIAGVWAAFDKIKADHFGTPAEQKSPNAANILAAKALSYRYALFADRFAGSGISGLGELPGNDFMITLGAWATPGGTAKEQEGTFMHELGHTLGLRHGGTDDVTYKPNYGSVMNYTWQTPEALYADSWRLDYSRQQLPTLDETALDKTPNLNGRAGIMVPVGPAIDKFNKAGKLVRVRDFTTLAPENGKIDWAAIGTKTKTGISADVNYIFDAAKSPGDTLTGAVDWSGLHYYFLEDPTFQTGVHGKGTDTGPDELDYDLNLALGQSAQFHFEPTSSPTVIGTPSFIPTEDGAYTPTNGYGWLDGSPKSLFDSGRGDDLVREGIGVTGSGTFSVDMPDRNYMVSVIMGSEDQGQSQVALSLEGQQVAVVNTAPGQFYEAVFPVTVTNTRLTLDLNALGGQALLNSLTITPVGSLPLAEVRGSVFTDLHGDGVLDPGDPLLAGRTVYLSGPSGTQTTLTDASGQYVFEQLPNGVYQVSTSSTSNGTAVSLSDGQALSVSFGLPPGSGPAIYHSAVVTSPPGMGGTTSSSPRAGPDLARPPGDGNPRAAALAGTTAGLLLAWFTTSTGEAHSHSDPSPATRSKEGPAAFSRVSTPAPSDYVQALDALLANQDGVGWSVLKHWRPG